VLTKEKNSIKTLALNKKLVINYKASLLKSLKSKKEKTTFLMLNSCFYIKA